MDWIGTWRGLIAILVAVVGASVAATLRFVDQDATAALATRNEARIVRIEASVRDLQSSYASMANEIAVMGRLSRWQICSRKPRPGPDVLAALDIRCDFPAATMQERRERGSSQ